MNNNTIDIKELAEKYDGRCFLDLDMPDRIEALMFTKTEEGLQGEYITCNYYCGYTNVWVDKFDYIAVSYDDLYNGSSIEMIENGMQLHKEITKGKYEEIKNIVIEQIKKADKLKAEFAKLQEQILNS
jgi:hypothetical protein